MPPSKQKSTWSKYVLFKILPLSFETFFYIIKNERDISDLSGPPCNNNIYIYYYFFISSKMSEIFQI